VKENLSMKEGYLFVVFIMLRSPNDGASCPILAIFVKPLDECTIWFHEVLPCGGEMIEYLIIFQQKYHLNLNQK
jgi:hypothetical protein